MLSRRTFLASFPGTAGCLLLGTSLDDTRDGWLFDLRYLARELPRLHKNLFFHLPRSSFDKSVAELEADIPRLDEARFVMRLAQLVAAIGDGHTAVRLPAGFDRRLPVRFYWFQDGIYATHAETGLEGMLGSRLLAIDAVDIDVALAKIRSAVAFENESWFRNLAPDYLMRPDVLHALRVTQSPMRASVQLEDSRGRATRFDLNSRRRQEPISWQNACRAPMPLCQQQPAKNYWRAYDPKPSLLYLKYNRCADDPVDPFSRFAEATLKELDGKTDAKLVIDLRHNGGGNSSILWPLLKGIRQRDRFAERGRLFAIIGRGTFSSAELNANELKTAAKAILVGEPTGQKPNAYGEVKEFGLPNTGLTVSYSTKYFKTVPGDPDSLWPDIYVAPRIAEYIAARDPVLDRICS